MCVRFLAGVSQWRGSVSNKLFERTYFWRLMASLAVVLAEDVVACSESPCICVSFSLLVHQLALEHNLAAPFSIDEKSSTLTDLI
jgi:hypothetical protein